MRIKREAGNPHHLKQIGICGRHRGQLRAKVGGHLYSYGRFCWRWFGMGGARRLVSPSAWRSYRHSSFSQIGGRRFPAHLCGFLNAPQRPSQPPQCDDLLFGLLVQDVAHIDAGYSPSRLS
jgi:hypothetical protein